MLQDFIRKRNLFAPPIDPSMNLDLSKMDLRSNPTTDPSSDTTQQQQPDESHGLADVYGKLVSAPPGPAQQKYRDFLDTAPNREDYQPNKVARVAAMLAGISEGAQGDAGKAFKTSQSMLDDGYNTAVEDYKLRGDRLGKSADLEEKDINNRVKTYRDIIQDQNTQNTNARQNRLTDAQIQNYKSLEDDRRSQQATRGFTPFTNPLDGKRYTARPNATGGVDRYELGTAALTPEQNIDLSGKKAGAESNAKFPNEIKLANARAANSINAQNAKFKNIKDLLEFKKGLPNVSIEHLSDGSIVLIDKANNTMQDTGFNSGKLGDTEKAALGLKNAKELKSTPGPDKTVETKVSEDGKTKTTTTKSTGSSQGKVRMTDPTGKPFLVDPKEVDAAVSHGWKKVG